MEINNFKILPERIKKVNDIKINIFLTSKATPIQEMPYADIRMSSNLQTKNELPSNRPNMNMKIIRNACEFPTENQQKMAIQNDQWCASGLQKQPLIKKNTRAVPEKHFPTQKNRNYRQCGSRNTTTLRRNSTYKGNHYDYRNPQDP